MNDNEICPCGCGLPKEEVINSYIGIMKLNRDQAEALYQKQFSESDDSDGVTGK